MTICCFPFRHQLVPHSVPNFSPVPLCNELWGLGVCVCSVLVRSVSPCRLVLEVHLFPSPLRCFGLLPVVCVRLFCSSCLSRLTRLRPGVRVCVFVCVCGCVRARGRACVGGCVCVTVCVCVCVASEQTKNFSRGPGTHDCLSWPRRPDSMGV